jgi:hypothetical protein
VVDFRSDPSESAEGKGIAARAWESYVRATNKYVGPALSPVVDPVARMAARGVTEDLLGFWVLWHLCGGFEGLQRFGMHRATIWRKVKKFRIVFGKHPDEYRFTGVEVTPGAAWHAIVADSDTTHPAGETE